MCYLHDCTGIINDKRSVTDMGIQHMQLLPIFDLISITQHNCDDD